MTASTNGSSETWYADSQTQSWTRSTSEADSAHIGKSGTYDAETETVAYSLVINEDGADLIEGSDVLTLTDVLSYISRQYLEDSEDTPTLERDYNIIYGSVKLYDYEQYMRWQADSGVEGGDGEITDWSWVAEKTTAERVYSWTDDSTGKTKYTDTAAITLTATVPDGRALLLVYSYDVCVAADVFWERTLGASNTAKLEGYASVTDGSQSYIAYEDAGASGSVRTKNHINIYKISSENYYEILGGAAFTFYKFTGTDESELADDAMWTEYITFTTDAGWMSDSDGLDVSFRLLDGGRTVYSFEGYTLYKIVETAAPDGYCRDGGEEPIYVYWTKTTSPKQSTDYPDWWKDVAWNLADASQTVYITNTPVETVYTSLTLEKEWFSQDGTAITKAGGVDVELYRVASTVNTLTVKYNGETVKQAGFPAGSTVTLTATNAWSNGFERPVTVAADGVTLTEGTDYTKTASGNAEIFTLELTMDHDVTVEITQDWWNVTDWSFVTSPDSCWPLTAESDDGDTGVTVTVQWSDGTVIETLENCAEGTVITVTAVSNAVTDDYFRAAFWYNGVYGQLTPETAQSGSAGSTVYTRTVTYTVGGAGQDVTVQLYQYDNYSVEVERTNPGAQTAASSVTPTGGTYAGTYTITDADGWTRTITDLPANGVTADGDCVVYTYYVVERRQAGFAASYVGNTGVSGGTITIRNQADGSVALPATGGSGRAWITILAAALLTLGAGGYACTQARRRV